VAPRAGFEPATNRL